MNEQTTQWIQQIFKDTTEWLSSNIKKMQM